MEQFTRDKTFLGVLKRHLNRLKGRFKWTWLPIFFFCLIGYFMNIYKLFSQWSDTSWLGIIARILGLFSMYVGGVVGYLNNI